MKPFSVDEIPEGHPNIVVKSSPNWGKVAR